MKYNEYTKAIAQNRKNAKRNKPGGGKAQRRSLTNKARAMRRRSI